MFSIILVFSRHYLSHRGDERAARRLFVVEDGGRDSGWRRGRCGQIRASVTGVALRHWRWMMLDAHCRRTTQHLHPQLLYYLLHYQFIQLDGSTSIKRDNLLSHLFKTFIISFCKNAFNWSKATVFYLFIVIYFINLFKIFIISFSKNALNWSKARVFYLFIVIYFINLFKTFII